MTDLWITLGPSSIDRLDELVTSGVRGVRLTFSFGTPELQEERARAVKAAALRCGVTCLTVADLPGEKIRLGLFDGAETVAVKSGQVYEFVLSDRENPSVSGKLPLPHASFVSKLSAGDSVVIGDGSAVLDVEGTHADGATVRSRFSGVINQTRGVTLQSRSFVPRCTTADDERHLGVIAKSDAFDMVALSFVSSRLDVSAARSVLRENGRELPIISKIETAIGVDRVEEICVASDMVMAARGDLALCMPWTELPKSVTSIADAATLTDTPWVLATQIAEGLERFALPTRAEICDLAHWLQRGCAAVMLSYETVFGCNATGAVECTQMLLDRWSGTIRDTGVAAGAK
jgi:pyruvate kinase